MYGLLPALVLALGGAAGYLQWKDVSLHETTLVDGVSRMREVERLPVAAGKSVELKPGGLHLMLMDGTGSLQEGKRVGIVLVDAPGTLPPELAEELQACERASANALELVERLVREQAPHEKG